MTGFGDQFRIDSPRDERTKHCLGSSLNVLRQACPGPYPITSHVIGRAGGGAGSDLGVAQQAVCLSPSLEAKNCHALPATTKNHVGLSDGMESPFRSLKSCGASVLAADAKALSLVNYSKEVVAELDKMAEGVTRKTDSQIKTAVMSGPAKKRPAASQRKEPAGEQ